MQNLKYSILLMDLGDAEQPYLVVVRMKNHHGGNLVPVAREVINHIYACQVNLKKTSQ